MAEEKPRIAMVRPTKDKSAGAQTLRILEKKYRIYPEAEIIPYARNTSFVEIAENVVPDRDFHDDRGQDAGKEDKGVFREKARGAEPGHPVCICRDR